MEELLSVTDFSAKIKEKYPEYKDIDDEQLVASIVEKYPEYKGQVSLGAEVAQVDSAAVAPALEAESDRLLAELTKEPEGPGGYWPQMNKKGRWQIW
mgnify:FL=1